MSKVSYSRYYLGHGSHAETEEETETEERRTPPTLSTTAREFRAICVDAPHTLPSLRLDLTKEEEEGLSKPARAALARLKALWAEDD